MSSLAIASSEQISRIYSESFALWGAGLSEQEYRRLWDEVAATPWARSNASFLVWQDGRGRVLSSLKLYRPWFRVFDRTVRVAVLGAVFTPRSRRRRGYAAALIRAVLERQRQAGDAYAMLFSDIGTEYYRAFGFETLPATEEWGSLPRDLDPPAGDWSLRDATASDEPHLVAAHDRFLDGQRIALLRDGPHWEFLRVRAESYFARLGDRGVRARRSVARRNGEDVGYLLTVEGRGEWNVREVGARDGSLRTMAAILTLAAREARRAGLRRFYAWLPPGLDAELTGWRVRSSPRRRARPMLRRLSDDSELPAPGAWPTVHIPYQDQF